MSNPTATIEPVATILSTILGIKALRSALKLLRSVAPASILESKQARTFFACFNNETWVGARSGNVKMLARCDRSYSPSDGLHCFPIERLERVAKSIDPENEVKATWDNGMILTLESRQRNGLRSTFNLQTYLADGIELPEACGVDCWSTPARDFSEAIESAKVAMGEVSGHDCDGIFLDCSGETIEVKATDGSQLFRRKLDSRDSGPIGKAFLRSENVKAILSVLKATDDYLVRFRMEAAPTERVLGGKTEIVDRVKFSLRTDNVILEIMTEPARFPLDGRSLGGELLASVELTEPAILLKAIEAAWKTSEPDVNGVRPVTLVSDSGSLRVETESLKTPIGISRIIGKPFSRTFDGKLLIPYLKTIAKLDNLAISVSFPEPGARDEPVRFHTVERGEHWIMPYTGDKPETAKVKPPGARSPEPVKADPEPEPVVVASPEPVAAPEPAPTPDFPAYIEHVATPWHDVQPGARIYNGYLNQTLTVRSISKSWCGGIRIDTEERGEIIARHDAILEVIPEPAKRAPVKVAACNPEPDPTEVKPLRPIAPTPVPSFPDPAPCQVDPAPEFSRPEVKPGKVNPATLSMTLPDGTIVGAKRFKGEIIASTYANRTQAEKRRDAMIREGLDAEVIQRGRPFFVRIGEAAPSPCHATPEIDPPVSPVAAPDAPESTPEPLVDAAELNGEVPSACSSVPLHVKRVELLTTAWKSVGDIFYRSAPGCWKHERTGSEIWAESMNHYHSANMVVFLPDPDADHSGADYGHKSTIDPDKAVDVGPVPASLAIPAASVETPVPSFPGPETGQVGPARELSYLAYDVVQTVKPGARTSDPVGEWCVGRYAKLKHALAFADNCNRHCTVETHVSYRVVCTHDDATDRFPVYAEWKREHSPKLPPATDQDRADWARLTGKSPVPTLPEPPAEIVVECHPEYQADTPGPDFSADEVCNWGPDPVPAFSRPDPIDSALMGRSRLARVELPTEVFDRDGRIHRAEMMAVERVIRAEMQGTLLLAEMGYDLDYIQARAALAWSRMTREEQADFLGWCAFIGYRPGEADHGRLADDEQWEVFAREVVAGSPIFPIKPLSPKGTDDEDSRPHARHCPNVGRDGVVTDVRGARESGRGPGDLVPNQESDPAGGEDRDRSGPRHDPAGTLVILVHGIGLPVIRFDTVTLPQSTYAPRPGVSRPTPSRAFLSLEIGGRAYGLTVNPDGYTLEKPDGELHEVAVADDGRAMCSCRDWKFRHSGLDTEGCRHIRALRSVRLMPPARSFPDPGPKEECHCPEDDATLAMIALGVLPISGGSPEVETTRKSMLTKIQVDAIRTAHRAKLDPNEKQGWSERFALAQCDRRTLLSLERKGLVESYINPGSDKIGWRLTEEGCRRAEALG